MTEIILALVVIMIGFASCATGIDRDTPIVSIDDTNDDDYEPDFVIDVRDITQLIWELEK